MYRVPAEREADVKKFRASPWQIACAGCALAGGGIGYALKAIEYGIVGAVIGLGTSLAIGALFAAAQEADEKGGKT